MFTSIQDDVFVLGPRQTQGQHKANIQFKPSAQTSNILEKSSYITQS